MDLNADVGESFGAYTMGDDESLLAVVTSANVACGFHAGDPVVMTRTVEAAIRRGVAVGAHVGYRDLHGFGRREIVHEPDQLRADIVYQLGALDAIARSLGTSVRYVKAHGALYNTAARDGVVARALVDAVASFGLPVLTLPGSAVTCAGEAAGVRVVAECFADRAYLPDGSLAPRSTAGAVIEDPDVVVARAVSMATDGVVRAVDGSEVKVAADSMCLHGDTPGAAALAAAVRDAFDAAGVAVEPFA